MKKVFLLFGFLFVALLSRAEENVSREQVLAEAEAAWYLGEGIEGMSVPLVAKGGVAFGQEARGEGADNRKVARMSAGYFDAGPDLNMEGEALTVYLRVRDPYGQWMHALMAKRGSHQQTNFNLFSANLDWTPGPDIGFEVHTDQGLGMVSFPVSRENPTGWQDLMARYDGTWLEILSNGKIQDRVRWEGPLTLNEEPLLIGAQTSNGEVEASFRGDLQEAAVWSRALSDQEAAAVMGVPEISDHPDASPKRVPYQSPIHYRPPLIKMGDTVPFYWDGEYHIFYLRATARMAWGHVVSTDLVNWTELPFALKPDGPTLGHTGENCGTGSVIEKDGVFHAFFTGWNPRNPDHREVAVHATSPDLIHWTNHPEHVTPPDGKIYKDFHGADFRDPYVYWSEEGDCYRMLIFAEEKKSSTTMIGVYESDDLVDWKAREPVKSFSGQECPDLFQIGDRYYLLGAFRYGISDRELGPYQMPRAAELDTPMLYAGKRMFDGKRHVWTAWFRDLEGKRDAGAFEWGGSQCLPRELYAGAKGELCVKPVEEVTSVFSHQLWSLGEAGALSPNPAWELREGVLVGTSERFGSQQTFPAPDHYMLTCRVRLEDETEFSLVFREQPDTGDGYTLVLRPGKQEIELRGRTFSFPRHCEIDLSQPVTVQAFVQGDMIETFINDRYAFSCRAYDFQEGLLGLNVRGGRAVVESLKIFTHVPAEANGEPQP